VSIIRPGTPVPDFVLRRSDGSEFTRDDLQDRTTVLVFYPHAFSPVCSEQMQVYEEALDDLREQGVVIYGVSTDSVWSQQAFKDKLGVSIDQLSDFEPKGATARKFGAYFEPAGMTNRAIVLVGPDGVVRWSHLADSPGDLPGVNLIFDALQEPAAS
jgi:peroxiredoxin (alkyl hydroperoxide reductase subunit C)